MSAEPAMEPMKWWGWGDERIEFDMDAHPDLWSYIARRLKLEDDLPHTPPVAFDAIVLPEQRTHPAFVRALQDKIGADQIRDGKKERVTHAFGKSLRDLWRVRNGIIPYAPDYVVYPRSYDHVCAVMTEANEKNVRLIPFGGGSNITGCLEPTDPDPRPAVSVDMRQMNRLLHLDRESRCARFEAGTMGPQVEEQLNPLGYTLGHFPDSFLFSTIGGWVASRSAGMKSDYFGKIEDMVVSLRMVTPVGTIETRAVPKASNGIDVNRLCIGSEGVLGIITDVLLQVHPLPGRELACGYLFPDFAAGVQAMRECVEAGCGPVMARLNDAEMTVLAVDYGSSRSIWKRRLEAIAKTYLSKIHGLDVGRACLMLAKFEGSNQFFSRNMKGAESIYRKFGAVSLGSAPGRAFESRKYEFPYLRDFVMDRGILSDVSETATVWSNLLTLYNAVQKSIYDAFARAGCNGSLGCHISHSYHTGASLYFTYAFHACPGRELAQYLQIKKAAEDTFLAHGATLSHHHAVGYEHMPWLEAEISPAGVRAIQSLKEGVDPQRIMNPGKLRGGFGFREWGLDGSFQESEASEQNGASLDASILSAAGRR